MDDTCDHFDVCGRDALEGHDGKCILHSHDRGKHTGGVGNPLKEAIDEHLENYGPDFRHMSFLAGQQGFDFRGFNFSERANFEDATFWNMARFDGASFPEGAYFLNTSFESGATFAGDGVLIGVNFVNASFEGPAIFADSTLLDSRFSETDFEENCSFERTTFENVHFKGGTILDSSFDRGEFKDVYFEDVILQTTSFHKCNLSKVTFEAVEFNGRLNHPEFSNTTFSEANFEGVVFQNKANFNRATIQGCTFQDATFKNRATFQKVIFTGRISFRGVEFQQDALFQDSFEPARDGCLETVDFGDCHFQRKASFSGSSDESRAFTRVGINFTGVRLSPRAELQFRYADLSHCRFLRTNLRDIEFTAVEWCDRFSYSGSLTDSLINDKYDEMRTSWFRKKEWFHRIGLYDELYEGASGDESGDERWHEVERLYRQLKRNYEERGDFPRGGDFHIGEKEARRQGNNRWGPRLLLNTYRALSKYGERALPAFSWLLALVPIFALIYFLLGASTCPLCEPSYPDALISSLEATLYPVRPVGFEDFWPQIFSIVQRIISPILIALLALALRQRVKR